MTSPIILAVDDRPDNLFVLEQLIGEYAPGCVIITATSAEQGLKLAAGSQIDLALLDVQMPGMDGLEMCRQLKGHDTTKHVPVILMTAHRTSTDLRVRGLEAGADDFISKPVDNAELGARIKVMLRIKKAEDLLRRERDRLEETIRAKTKELRESQGRYQTLAEMSPVGIFRTDPQGNCVYVNDRWRGISGLTAVEALGRGWLRGVDPRDRERVAREWSEALKKNTSFLSEYRFQRQDGTITWVLGQAAPEKGTDEETIGYVGAVTDITLQKKAEGETLLHEKLLAAIETSGAVCHEMNQPMQIVMSEAETLLDRMSEDDPMRRSIERILRELERMGKITKQLQGLVRYKTREYAYSSRILDLEESSN